MGETANIARMAEIISDEIFSVFGWKTSGPMNQSWNCVLPEHEKKDHPSDVVYYYDEPYSEVTTYVNCDLKSYAVGSITANSLTSALQNISFSIDCAQVSSDWQKQHLINENNFEIVGLLFIYNHDGDYDKNFHSLLEESISKDFKINSGNRIFVFGPKDIIYLKTIANDIDVLRGKKILPESSFCSFFFPDLINKRVVRTDNINSSTLEMLAGPWQIVRYYNSETDVPEGSIVYYKRSGEDYKEFLALFDYLFHYQCVLNDSDISIRLPNADRYASVMFEKAKNIYCEDKGQEFSQRMNRIQYKPVTNILTKFYDIEIGMRI